MKFINVLCLCFVVLIDLKLCELKRTGGSSSRRGNNNSSPRRTYPQQSAPQPSAPKQETPNYGFQAPPKTQQPVQQSRPVETPNVRGSSNPVANAPGGQPPQYGFNSPGQNAHAQPPPYSANAPGHTPHGQPPPYSVNNPQGQPPSYGFNSPGSHAQGQPPSYNSPGGHAQPPPYGFNTGGQPSRSQVPVGSIPQGNHHQYQPQAPHYQPPAQVPQNPYFQAPAGSSYQKHTTKVYYGPVTHVHGGGGGGYGYNPSPYGYGGGYGGSSGSGIGTGIAGLGVGFLIGSVTSFTLARAFSSSGSSYNNAPQSYSVHHYYHDRETIPPAVTITDTQSVVPCDPKVSQLCTPNTVPLCMSNGTIMCVTESSKSVVCGANNLKCVLTTIPCSNGTAGCNETGTQNNTTIGVPCLSSASIPITININLINAKANETVANQTATNLGNGTDLTTTTEGVVNLGNGTISGIPSLSQTVQAAVVMYCVTAVAQPQADPAIMENRTANVSKLGLSFLRLFV